MQIQRLVGVGSSFLRFQNGILQHPRQCLLPAVLILCQFSRNTVAANWRFAHDVLVILQSYVTAPQVSMIRLLD